VAVRVYDQYLSKHAEDMNPLLFGDRGGVPDGPATQKVKNWSPPDMRPIGKPGAPAESGGGLGGGGGAGEAAGEGAAAEGAGAAAEGAGAGAAIGEAAELLPLLAL
jgi:hypothetical protein